MEVSIPGPVLALVYSQKKTQEEIKNILMALRDPFPADVVSWRPQSVKGQNGQKHAQALVYADPRAYSDRLNEVVGVQNWFQFTSVAFSPEFKKSKSVWENKVKVMTEAPIVKCVVTAVVGIIGVGIHCDAGESWADDENAHTIAYAQAFKRACYHFGLGRYLYDLEAIDHPCNDYGALQKPYPELPDWALPAKYCEECPNVIEAVVIGEKLYKVSTLINNSKTKYDKQLCFPCQKKRSEAAKAAGGSRVGAANNQPKTKVA